MSKKDLQENLWREQPSKPKHEPFLDQQVYWDLVKALKKLKEKYGKQNSSGFVKTKS